MIIVLTKKTFYLLITFVLLFFIGMLGLVLNRGNLLKTIMSLELLLLSVNLNFILFSVYLDDIMGHIFVVFILTLSATESALGLAILSVFYKKRESINVDVIKSKNKNLKF